MINKLKSRELLIQSVFAVFIKVIGALLATVASIIIARNLGVEKSGVYFLFVSVVTFFTTIGIFGLNNASLKLVSAFFSKKDNKRLNGVILKSLIISGFISIVIALGLCFFSELITVHIFNFDKNQNILRILSFCIPLIALYTIFSHILQGQGKIIPAMLITGPLSSAFIIIIFMSFNIRDLNEASFTYLFASGSALIISLLFISQTLNFNTYKQYDTQSLLSLCIPMLTTQVIIQGSSQAGVIFLGLWGTTSEIAVFSAAFKVAALSSFILMAVNRVVAPKFSMLFANSQFEELANVVKQSTRIIVISSVLITSIMVVYAKEILSLFGNDFSQGSLILIIIAIGQLLNSATGSVAYLLQMTGHEKIQRNNVIISTIISLSSGLILIPLYGGLGAAIMTFISLSCVNLLSWYYVRKELKINTLAIF